MLLELCSAAPLALFNVHVCAADVSNMPAGACKSDNVTASPSQRRCCESDCKDNKSHLVLEAEREQVIACSPCLPQGQLLPAFWVCLWCVLMKTAMMQLRLFSGTVCDGRLSAPDARSAVNKSSRGTGEKNLRR